MLAAPTQYIRQRLRALRKARYHPILLPHRHVTDRGVETWGRPTRLPCEGEGPLRALRLCDGTRTLAQVARQANVARSTLLDLHDAEMVLLWRSPLPASPPAPVDVRAIIVSPHPDDASLSLGGMMLGAAPGRTLVLDVFTRTAWSRFPHELNDVALIAAIRRAEEDLMARMAGAAVIDLDQPEALLRDHEFTGVFSDSPRPWDQQVLAGMRETVADLRRRFPAATWFLPLTVGDHLDHRVVRNAALAALQATELDTDAVRFYEDLPYAAAATTPDFSGLLPGRRLQPQAIDIHSVRMEKVELNRAYWSQLSWGQLATLLEYARRIGNGRAIERVWRIA